MPEHTNGNRNLEELTLRDLFSLSADSPPEIATGLKAKDFDEIGSKIAALKEPIPWSRVQSEIAGLLSDALNTSVLEVWASAWKTYKELKQDAEESRRSPGAVVLSRLAEHSINSTLHPYVEVLLGREMLGKITFDVTLTTVIKGLLLGLKNGQIVSLQLAKCEWAGSIGTKGITLLERELAKLDLPGRINLKHGLSLAPLNEG